MGAGCSGLVRSATMIFLGGSAVKNDEYGWGGGEGGLRA
jgi:hypothetical protein